MSTKILTIIVNYHSEKFIYKNIKIISKTNHETSKLNIKIIVVDNGHKNAIDMLQIKQNKFTKVINTGKNIGFSRAVNSVLKSKVFCKNTDYFLLLNPDTILNKNSIKNLVRCSIYNDAYISGGKNFKQTGEVHGTIVRKPNFFTFLFEYTNLRKLIPYDFIHNYYYYNNLVTETKTSMEVDVVSGSYMLIKKDLIQKIGLFDENYFMYLEDVDYCNRAKKNDCKVIYCPKSTIVHIGGYSSRDVIEKINVNAWIKSRWYYANRNFNIISKMIIIPILLIDNMSIKFLTYIKNSK